MKSKPSWQLNLIANSGIQTITFPLCIDTQERYKMWYREWYDYNRGEWKLEPVYELQTEEGEIYYNKHLLYKGGYLADVSHPPSPSELKADGITPLRIDDVNCQGVEGEIFKMTFTDRDNKLSCFENVWLPAPYFFKQTKRKFKFGALNWSRFKLVPTVEKAIKRTYNVILAFDTRTKYGQGEEYDECPVFTDEYRNDMLFELCDNEFLLMDFCTSKKNWSYIDNYLFHLVHPNLKRVSQIKGDNIRQTSYSATYMFLVSYIAHLRTFPTVRLYKDKDVETNNVDMVVDIGNSRTTALLVGEGTLFNNVRQLELIDYTDMLKYDGDCVRLNSHNEPFDMRIAFRKVDFGGFGMADSKQFVYPSLVRLGCEASMLLHKAANIPGEKAFCTYSSPKRYLWDSSPSKDEWRYLVLDGEESDNTLSLPGITKQLKSNGKIDPNGQSGISFHYSRRSLMTLSFLEMLAQARTQINRGAYISEQSDTATSPRPHKIKRMIVTCPTAMSKLEREALAQCAKDAVTIIENFNGDSRHIEVIPSIRSRDDDETTWYYDEATCTQLVYMYGEVGYKYRGCSEEFFKLYGKQAYGCAQPAITIGSIDIGAGTSDMMISKYTYSKGDITTITPNPLFYDSYYYAGDDMLYSLVKKAMLLDRTNALGQELRNLSDKEYRQKIKNFFGKDYNLQTVEERVLRRDFNMQYSIPLMYHFLDLLSHDSKDCTVHYSDVFHETGPSESVVNGFKDKMGIDITTLTWKYDRKAVYGIVHGELEPLLKKVATIMHSFGCDIILLSGRPASLPPVRDIFLKYYPVSPNRLIVLNNFYVGDWYPFSENTGHIRNPKTIVAMGGIIGHYASELSRMDKFAIDLSKLNKNLKSTVNYIGIAGESVPARHIISPSNNQGEITLSSLPMELIVKQVGIPSYPGRALYLIDFNRHKIADRIRKTAYLDSGELPTGAKIEAITKETVDNLRRRMPFKTTIKRDAYDKEKLYIDGIVDKNGNDLADSNIEIHIQSLGVNERYWLDTGEFDF